MKEEVMETATISIGRYNELIEKEKALEAKLVILESYGILGQTHYTHMVIDDEAISDMKLIMKSHEETIINDRKLINAYESMNFIDRLIWAFENKRPTHERIHSKKRG